MPLTVWRSSHWAFWRTSSTEIYMVFFLWLWVPGRKTPHCPDIIAKVQIVNVLYECGCWPRSPGWGGVCQASPVWCSPLPRSVLFGRASPCADRARGGELCSLPWGHCTSVHHLEFFCMRELTHFPFVNLFIHLFSVSSWIFIFYSRL